MKKTLTRRQSALRALGALAALVLVMHLCDLYNFTPAAAVRDREVEMGLERTEILQRERFFGEELVLSGNEQTLLVTALRFHPLVGWRCSSFYQMTRDSALPLQLSGNSYGDSSRTAAFLCGWAEDRSVQELELRLQCRQWYGAGAEDVDVFVTVDRFLEHNGRRVFFFVTEEIPPTYTLRSVWLQTEEGEQLLLSW